MAKWEPSSTPPIEEPKTMASPLKKEKEKKTPWEPQPKTPKIRGKDILLALAKDMDLSRFSFFQQPISKWTFSEEELQAGESRFKVQESMITPMSDDELERTLKEAQASLDSVTERM
ncbi:hypothetical protein PYCC9005_003265 [Savitreella phatthalungensis]